MITLGLVLVLVGWVEAAIRIHSPSYLSAKYPQEKFRYQLSSFGSIPYGHTILGNFQVPYPEHACGNDVKVDYTKEDEPLILIVMRGNCSFLEKVTNGQNLKASMVIIVDNQQEDVRYVIPWAENSELLNIRIPSLVLEHSSGVALMDDVKRVSSDKVSNVVGAVSFPIIQQEKSIVFYQFDLNDRPLFETFFEIMKFFPNLKSHIELQAGYNIAPNYGTESKEGWACLNGSLWCEKREDGKQVSKENQPLFESIRQLCLSKIDSDSWWHYVSEFYKTCLTADENQGSILTEELKHCSDKIVRNIEDRNSNDLSNKLKSCMSDIEGDNVKSQSKLETYLYENGRVRNVVHSVVKPGLMINGQLIYGRMTSLDVLKEICESLKDKPNECKQIAKMKDTKFLEGEHLTFLKALWYIIKLILVSVVLVGAFYLVYKIKLRKDMEKKLNSEVDNALANYYMQNKGGRWEGVSADEPSLPDTSQTVDLEDDPDVDN